MNPFPRPLFDVGRRACDRRLDELRRAWRAAAQERITNELLEVVAGHEAACFETERVAGRLGSRG